ncbi:sugar diacid recognition domain-containing protein [Clostridium sp. MB40-C1]|uniref:CdaR family transcriptional regulator n=1 Tax=Clostridium sp. MB40-C1 TaxID=3070996 RepID=UPI0027DF97F0|nr:sugar diacid recognition domain-containing protein [Clostridium sp. MB40-C1]WMJ79345.1 sugar diacid recognition domain-containing protein [Clostridium sp. MB40-C1]
MIHLTNQLAQDIVNKMMEVIPYNVNIMNSEGVIIGSGDSTRIGKIHEGAVKAISLKKLVMIYKDKGGAKPGVNMPIYFKGEIMGVIGISGEPDIVKQFASIVKATATLLINQEYMFSEQRSREQLKDELLYQWAFLIDKYDEDFIKRAAELNIDLTIPRKAVVISSKRFENIKIDKVRTYIEQKEYIIRINPEEVVLLLKDDKILNYRIKQIYKEDFLKNSVIGIGTNNAIISKSVQEALKCVEIIKKLDFSMELNEYNKIIPIDALSNVPYKEKYFNIIKKLQEEGKGSDLIKTLICFIKNNGEINSIAKELHIHRNSLNYRIRKIQDITGKNLRNYTDLLELFTALVVFKLDKSDKSKSQ